MFSQIGPLEIILVLAIALIVLGPKRLPDAGRSVGRGLRNFKNSVAGDDKDDDEERKRRRRMTKKMKRMIEWMKSHSHLTSRISSGVIAPARS